MCEERTSKGTETKHGQSSVPFLILKRFFLIWKRSLDAGLKDTRCCALTPELRPWSAAVSFSTRFPEA